MSRHCKNASMEQAPVLSGILSETSLKNTNAYGKLFRTAKPFRHIIVDDFFERDFATRLLEDFPSFDTKYALNEFGKVGGKAVIESFRKISDTFSEADRMFSSEDFLAWASEVTGIPNLLYDEENFGGGTHENIDGQDLLPHVDFNVHPKTGQHRRLNLIVYLNEGWRREWGGSIQIHSNPRKPEENVVRSYEPLFNRAIIFETNEYSWHGFDRISLPEDAKHNSRKSLSIYLYTAERPVEETAGTHATFYVPRPLSFELQAGQPLTAAEVTEIRHALRLRDELVEMHQSKEAELEGIAGAITRYAAEVKTALARLQLPISGYARQIGDVHGLFADGFIGPQLEFQVKALRDVSSISMHLRSLEQMPRDAQFSILLDGVNVWRGQLSDTVEEVTFEANILRDHTATIKLECTSFVNLAALGVLQDDRNLSAILEDVVLDDAQRLTQIESLEASANAVLGYKAEIESALSQLRLPISGYARQVGDTVGFSPDGWIGSALQFQIRALRRISAVSISARLAPELPADACFSVKIGETLCWEGSAGEGETLEMNFKAAIATGETSVISITSSAIVNLASLGVGNDSRDLSAFIEDIVFEADPG